MLNAPSSGSHPPAWAVAAGLAAPVSGQRATLLPEAEATLAEAHRLYGAFEASLGEKFWRPMTILRCFHDAPSAERWKRRCEEPAFQAYLKEVDPARLAESPALKPLHAAFEIRGGGHLNINGLVPALHLYLERRGALRQARLESADLELISGGVRWQGVEARQAVFCEGLGSRENCLFPALTFQATRGEMLELSIPGFHAERVLYGRHFLIPLGQERYLCGATYDREDLSSGPTAAGRDELESGLRELLRIPYQVTGQRCGLRPNVLGHAALWQRHPQHPKLWRLNGLGSKGAWSAPRLTLQALQELSAS